MLSIETVPGRGSASCAYLGPLDCGDWLRRYRAKEVVWIRPKPWDYALHQETRKMLHCDGKAPRAD